MVNVDELNGYIEKFGKVVDKLDTLGESAEAIERATIAQEEVISTAKQVLDEQKKSADLLKTQWKDAQLSINTHIDNTENHLSSKIDLSEQQSKELIKEQIDSVRRDVTSYKSDFDEKIKTVKTVQYVSIACTVITAILVVVMHFV